MGKAWDHGVPSADVWREVLRVVKPGAHLLAFGGTRTFHRLTCAIEDAGFEIRDCLSWLHGQGFPKSLDISKALDKAAGAEREILPGKRHDRYNAKNGTTFGGSVPLAEHWNSITAPATDAAARWQGYGTALKPAWEPCIVAMKPCDGTFAENALAHGVAGVAIDSCRRACSGDYRSPTRASGEVNSGGTFGAGVVRFDDTAREAFGRWPANVLLDEESARALDAQSGMMRDGVAVRRRSGGNTFGGDKKKPQMEDAGFGGSGGASRFFYVAKPSRGEREAGLREAKVKMNNGNDSDGDPVSDRFTKIARNHHPTVKPIRLAEYLARLILPPKRDTPRRLLVPFSGSGSEMIGALLAGWDEVVGIECEAEYVEIAEARLRHWVDGQQLELEASA